MFLILKTTYFFGYADDGTPFEVRNNIAGAIKSSRGNRRKLSKLGFE